MYILYIVHSFIFFLYNIKEHKSKIHTVNTNQSKNFTLNFDDGFDSDDEVILYFYSYNNLYILYQNDFHYIFLGIFQYTRYFT